MKTSDINVVLELGDKCNNNCIFCSIKGRKPFNLSTAEAKNKLARIRSKGFSKVQFCGGEPTIRKDLIKLVKLAKRMGFKQIGINSNARIFSYENFTKEIISAGCRHFSISIHGHKPEIHDKCTRTPGSFNQTLNGLKNILKYKKDGMFVKINFVLNSINISSLDDSIFNNEFTKFFNNELKNLDLISLLSMHPDGEAGKHPSLMFQIKKYCKIIDSVIESSKIPVKIFNIPFCSLKNKDAIIKEGGVYNSINNQQTDLRTGHDQMKTKFGFCKYCDFNGRCGGIWKDYIKKFGKDEFVPVIENKKSIYLEITKKCNQRCLFCVKPSSFFEEEDPHPEDLEKAILGIKNPKDVTLVLDGGEPTLSQHLLRLLSLAAERRVKNVIILTNGTMLADERAVNKIHDLTRKGLNIFFSVSLHSHRKEVSENLTQARGSFDKTINGIKNLGERNIPFSIYIVINRQNVDELTDIVKLASQLKAKSITFAYIWHSGEGSFARKNRDLFFRISEKQGKIREAIEECRKNGMGASWAGCGMIPFCLAKGFEDVLSDSMAIENDSKFVANKEGMKKFKLLSEDYAGEAKQKKRECKSCKYDSACQGIWNFYAEMFGNDELKPVKE